MTDEEIAKGLTEAECRAVRVMEDYSDSDTPCRNSRDLAREMTAIAPDDVSYDEHQAKFIARYLVSLGLAEAETGLVTSDGDFYGSGWRLNKLGLRVRAILEAQDANK